MRKSKFLLYFIVINILIGSMYGLILGEILYYKSSAYFTEYKFYEYSVSISFPERIGVGITGLLEGGWLGAISGIVLGLVGLIHAKEDYQKVVFRSLKITFLVTVFVTLLCTLWWFYKFMGAVVYVNVGPESRIPLSVEDPWAFSNVEMIYYFTYFGGILGLVGGIIHQFLFKWKVNKRRITA